MMESSSRVIRKLTAADGYLDLGLPALALAELEGIADAGSLRPAVAFMTGMAFKEQGRFDAAVELLQEAAETIPAPHNRDAWLALGECFRAAGCEELGGVSDLFADEPLVPEGWDDSRPLGMTACPAGGVVIEGTVTINVRDERAAAGR